MLSDFCSDGVVFSALSDDLASLMSSLSMVCPVCDYFTKVGMSMTASLAVGLSCGFLAKNLSTKLTNLLLYICGMGLGFLFTMLLPRVIKLSPWKGGSKLAKWYNAQPTAHMSTLKS